MINNSSFGFSKCGLNHRARRMQSSLLELLSRSRWCSPFKLNPKLEFYYLSIYSLRPTLLLFTANEAKIYFFLWQVHSNSFSIEETIHSGKWIALFNVWICKLLKTLFLIIVYSVTYSSILIHLLSRSTLLHYHASLASELKAPL